MNNEDGDAKNDNPGLPDPPELDDTSHSANYLGRRVYDVDNCFYLDDVYSCCSDGACCPHFCFCPPRTQEEHAEIQRNKFEANAKVAEMETACLAHYQSMAEGSNS